MTLRSDELRVILFDIGDTLVHAAPVGTAVTDLTPRPIGDTVPELRELAHTYRLGAVTDTSVPAWRSRAPGAAAHPDPPSTPTSTRGSRTRR